MRSTRNFWIELEVDGRATKVETGPLAANGEFRGTIYVRDEGDVLRAVEIAGQVGSDGELRVHVDPAAEARDKTAGEGFTVVTKR